jgi:hypothetical protein
MLCGARCINVSSDPANCGACGRACASGTTCSSGSCVAIAVGIAASGPCESEACGPTGELQCARAFTSGGFCTTFCSTGSTATEQGQCGGPGSTCVAHPPFADIPEGQGMCLRACNPAATSEATGGCRSGQGVHGLLGLHPGDQRAGHPRVLPPLRDRRELRRSDGRRRGPDALQRPHGPLLSHPRWTSRCASTATLATPRSSWPPVARSAAGVCFRIDTTPTHGLCGSYLNLGVSTNCPDNPALIRPVAPSNDNAAICVFKNCAHNNECASPTLCVYPESGGMIRTDVASRCAYPTALQPSGIP